MELLIPMLRADFELDDTYSMLPGPRLACPMSVYGGNEDPEVDAACLAAWNDLWFRSRNGNLYGTVGIFILTINAPHCSRK